jgi:hypothetical protein
MSEERRCDKCDRLIRHWNAHDGLDCENWPEWQKGVTKYDYRDFEVTPAYMGWQWLHKDYDGDEDRRAGHADTPNECFAEIDAFYDDAA